MNGRCDIVDIISVISFKCCDVCCECYHDNTCVLCYNIEREYENITIYSEGE